MKTRCQFCDMVDEHPISPKRRLVAENALISFSVSQGEVVGREGGEDHQYLIVVEGELEKSHFTTSRRWTTTILLSYYFTVMRLTSPKTGIPLVLLRS
jgi:hypothetical protein